MPNIIRKPTNINIVADINGLKAVKVNLLFLENASTTMAVIGIKRNTINPLPKTF